MILLRLDGLEGKYCDIQGGQEKYKYGESKSGWFPIESMNFGFQTPSESSADTTSGSNGSSTDTGLHHSGSHTRVTSAKAKGGTDEAFTTISVTKFVDGTTTSLMRFAMEDRCKAKSDRERMRKADFHFLHSVRGKETKEIKPTRFVFPYMMITLENVLVKGWNISAGADDRPVETIELWYDKAAMRYYRTKDGVEWIGGDVSGWDQYKNEPWSAPENPRHFEAPDTTR